MGELLAAVCSIAPTRRRRFLWAAWWTAPPEREPFRAPDASSGGARTREEALRAAERAAGRRLVVVDGTWARAWSRVLCGEPPFPTRAPSDGADARADGDGEGGRPGAGARGQEPPGHHAPPRSSPPRDPAPPGRAPRGADPPASIWALLGVRPGATLDEIRAAFHERALETHPDHGGDADRFRLVRRAYELALARHARRGRR